MLQLMKKRIRRSSIIRATRRLGRKQDGAAAVEFALVAGPFLLLLFAIIETAFVFFAGQTLETAVADSGRLIMTGQAQTKGFSQAEFKNAVCGRIFALFDCANGVHIDVRKYTTFDKVSPALPLDADGNFQEDELKYDPGVAGDIVVVRLFYQWPIYVSVLQNMSGNNRLLVAASAFRNEPFGATTTASGS